jgi:FkbM family methyltransferase
MSVQPDLVYDVGLHDGADTAYYLQRGLRVVAIEANPAMVEAARVRFAGPLSAGRLTLVPVGVASDRGTAQFWVCDDHTDWSSFDRSVASRGGAKHHAVEVELAPFHALLERYGIPRYCKVDIEGNDHLCLDDLTTDRRPDYLSVEFGRGEPLAKMVAVGYDRFKIVDQAHFTTVTSRYEAARTTLPRPVAAAADRVRNRYRGVRRDDDWLFRPGSSGPLPDRTRGAWLTPDEAREVLERIRASYRSDRRSLADWFDIHATDVHVLKSDDRVSAPRA